MKSGRAAGAETMATSTRGTVRSILWAAAALGTLAACASRPPDVNTGDRGDGARARMTGALLETGRVGVEDCGAQDQAQVAFMDGEVFDDNLSWYTRRGHAPLTVTGFDQRPPEQVPPRLMRWLWELKEHGGEVRTTTEYEGAAPRAFGLGWVLQIVSFAGGEVAAAYQEARKFGGLYHYDAEVVALQKTVAGEPVRLLKEVRLVCRPRMNPAPVPVTPEPSPLAPSPPGTEAPIAEPAAAPAAG